MDEMSAGPSFRASVDDLVASSSSASVTTSPTVGTSTFPAKEKQRRFRWSHGDDLELLRRICGDKKPFKRGSAIWGATASDLNKLRPGKAITARACSDRARHFLIEERLEKEGDEWLLQRSATHDEQADFLQLLDDAVSLHKTSKQEKNQAAASKRREEEDARLAAEMRDAALRTLKGKGKGKRKRSEAEEDDRIHGTGMGGVWTDEEGSSSEEEVEIVGTPTPPPAKTSRMNMRDVVRQRVQQKQQELNFIIRVLVSTTPFCCFLLASMPG